MRDLTPIPPLYMNPTLTGNFPGQGINNRSERATSVAKNTSRNPNLVISEAGASVELGGDISGGETASESGSTYVVNGQSEFIYYYHPDHLGSTGFVTDANGELYEHVEYFPFGETWVQERSNIQRTPYLFTGKELDEETQLYYYGARYYDPRTSVWQSADPILEKYLPSGNNKIDQRLPGIGGVFTPANLSVYIYSHNNPVVKMDPDGNVVVGLEAGGTASFDVAPAILGGMFGLDKVLDFYMDSPVLPEANIVMVISTIVAVELHMPFNDEGKDIISFGVHSNFEAGIEGSINIDKPGRAFSPVDGSLFAAALVGGNEMSLGDISGDAVQTSISGSVNHRGLFASRIEPSSNESDFYSFGAFLTTEGGVSPSISRTWSTTEKLILE